MARYGKEALGSFFLFFSLWSSIGGSHPFGLILPITVKGRGDTWLHGTCTDGVCNESGGLVSLFEVGRDRSLSSSSLSMC